jgi:hypothetical protein
MPQAVGDETGGADQVQPLKSGGAPSQLLRRDQDVGEQDHAGAHPAGDLDQDLGRAHISSR